VPSAAASLTTLVGVGPADEEDGAAELGVWPR